MSEIEQAAERVRKLATTDAMFANFMADTSFDSPEEMQRFIKWFNQPGRIPSGWDVTRYARAQMALAYAALTAKLAEAEKLLKQKRTTITWHEGEREVANQEIARLREANRKLAARLAEAQSDNERLVKVDFPELDATDAAHPAWWRGHDHGAESICREALRILDGGEIHGVCAQPWQAVRERLMSMHNRLAYFDDPTPLTPEAVMRMLPANRNPGHPKEIASYRGAFGVYVFWYRQLLEEGGQIWIESQAVKVSDIGTLGAFRHIATGLGIQLKEDTDA